MHFHAFSIAMSDCQRVAGKPRTGSTPARLPGGHAFQLWAGPDKICQMPTKMPMSNGMSEDDRKGCQIKFQVTRTNLYIYIDIDAQRMLERMSNRM